MYKQVVNLQDSREVNTPQGQGPLGYKHPRNPSGSQLIYTPHNLGIFAVLYTESRLQQIPLLCDMSVYTPSFCLQRIRSLRDTSVYTPSSAYNKFVYYVIRLFIHWVSLKMNSFIVTVVQ